MPLCSYIEPRIYPAKMKGGQGRSTKAETEQRIAVVYGLLTDGRSRYEIQQYAADETNWDVHLRTVDVYIKEARERMMKDCEIQREAFMAEALQGYRSIRTQAERRGQFMVAKSCIDAQVALVGLGA